MLDKQATVLQAEAAAEDIPVCSLVINIFPFSFLNIFSTWKQGSIEAQHLAVWLELALCLFICFFPQRPLPFYQQNVFSLISPINMPNKESEMVKFMVKQG